MELTQKHFDGGKIAYDAYCKQAGGRSLISGDKLPEFDALNPGIRNAWAAAYIAVANEEDRHTRQLLLSCRSVFESIQEYQPRHNLGDIIHSITEVLSR